MFNTYRVIVLTINQNDGEAEFTERKETLKEATDAFYNKCASYGTNPSTKACEVIVISPDGDIIRMEKIGNIEG